MIKIKLSDLLGKNKMTQRKLSKDTGIHPSIIGAYYHETVLRMDKRHIDAFCKVFKCEVEDLIEHREDEE
ncbi:MAG: family transcriptional regulator [Massilibacillus sp.]|jgi:putative transcriptional regulator|nr:family transcriptional regulator [Massilibacillus sp.]